MLQFGQNLISAIPDQLRKIQLDDLVKFIVEGAFDIQSQLSQLHRLMLIDPKKYQEAKRKLPYFTCAIFHPPFRKTENLAFVEYFVVDIDHLSQKEMSPEKLKYKVSADDRVLISFISPSGDGLKILFKLEEKITDPVKYSMFYKLFVTAFSKQYELSQVIDSRTCDAARVCFLSFDPVLYFNPNATPVNINDYINFESALEIEAVNETIKKIDAELKEANPDEPKNVLTDDVFREIKARLNPNVRTVKPADFYVPEKINELEKIIKTKAEELGISISSRPISYGKQITFVINNHKGELNVFYGKKGYSVIKSSKTGCSPDLNEIAYKLVCDIIF